MKWQKVAPEEKQKLAERLRAALAERRGVTEKRMFGGTCDCLRQQTAAEEEALGRQQKLAGASVVKR